MSVNPEVVEPVIEVEGVTLMWAPTAGLRPVSFTVDAGEMVVVRGRSGSGKSTLLAVLAGLRAPDAGRLRVAGGVPTPDTPWDRLAIVPQVLCLAAELTVRENIVDAVSAAMAGTVDDAVDDAVDALMTRLDIVDLAERCIDEVSMGQRQRTAVARACIARPRVVLVDEPTSFQDGRHATAVVDELRRVASSGSALVVATHDEIVIAAADRVVDLTV
jgi:ABC-type lipoprotein export system ATPase subunit